MYGRLEITADLRGSGVLAGDCSAVPEWDDLEAVLGGFGVSGDPMSVSWFVVTFDDQSITLSVSPPGDQPWNAVIAWDSVTRVCFEAADLLRSDSLYIFTSLRPESWVIPAEGEGGQRLLRELVRRGLFDADVAIKAAYAHEGLFCWPPPGEPDMTHDGRATRTTARHGESPIGTGG